MPDSTFSDWPRQICSQIDVEILCRRTLATNSLVSYNPATRFSFNSGCKISDLVPGLVLVEVLQCADSVFVVDILINPSQIFL